MDDTNAALRDKLAGLLGWRDTHRSHRDGGNAWTNNETGKSQGGHPIPYSLDALAAIWAERLDGWDMTSIEFVRHDHCKCNREPEWIATARKPSHPHQWSGKASVDARESTEYDARLALTIAALEAEKGRGK